MHAVRTGRDCRLPVIIDDQPNTVPVTDRRGFFCNSDQFIRISVFFAQLHDCCAALAGILNRSIEITPPDASAVGDRIELQFRSAQPCLCGLPQSGQIRNRIGRPHTAAHDADALCALMHRRSDIIL